MTVVLPDFVWAEVGAVLKKKVARGLISPEQAEVAWESFNSLGVINFVNDKSVMKAAWRIANEEALPTLYDAAYLAVLGMRSRQNGEECEFWAADKRLVNSLGGKKQFVKLLGNTNLS